jgi:hypothetical protein
MHVSKHSMWWGEFFLVGLNTAWTATAGVLHLPCAVQGEGGRSAAAVHARVPPQVRGQVAQDHLLLPSLQARAQVIDRCLLHSYSYICKILWLRPPISGACTLSQGDWPPDVPPTYTTTAGRRGSGDACVAPLARISTGPCCAADLVDADKRSMGTFAACSRRVWYIFSLYLYYIDRSKREMCKDKKKTFFCM